MINKFLSFFSGALGEKNSPTGFDAIAPEHEVWPDNGIVHMADIGDMNGTVSNVTVCVGGSIQAGQPLIEIETDKCAIEVPSPCSGSISEIFVEINTQVKTGDPLVKITRT